MSSTTGVPAAAGLEHKAASTSPESGLLEADERTGVVEAIVSVTGLRDEDNDVIVPGAYAKTLAKRRPKGIFVHDWGRWVARTEHVEELMPGDSRLPARTKSGAPWPAEAGGLFVRCRFNLGTTEGKDAFENVRFFSDTGECEWSVGYKVPPGKATRTKDGVRRIEEMDLFEYSPVLFGAAPLSGTLSVKSLGSTDVTPDSPAEEDEAAETGDRAEEVADESLDEDDLRALERLMEDGEEQEKALFSLTPPKLKDPLNVFRAFRDLRVPDISDEAMRDRVQASFFRLDQAMAAGDHSRAAVEYDIVLSRLRDASIDPVIRTWLVGEVAPVLRRAGAAENPPLMRIDDATSGASAQDPAQVQSVPGAVPASRNPGGRGEGIKHLPGQHNQQAHGNDAPRGQRTVGDQVGSKFTDKSPPKAGQRVYWRGAVGTVEEVWAKGEYMLPNMDYDGLDPEELEGIPEEDLYLPSASAMARVRFAGGRVEIRPVQAFSRAPSSKSLDRSPKKNWVEKAGGLPEYIEKIAKSIHEKRGLPLEEAIPIAIARVKKWAAGGDDVDADTKAKAAKAVAEWEALKARSKDHEMPSGNDEEEGGPESDHDTDTDTDTELVEEESKRFPHLPGSLEELREELRGAASAVLAEEMPLSHTEVMGTWHDRAVVAAYGVDGKALTYEVSYLVREGNVEVSSAVPVELKVTLGDQEEQGENLLPYPSVLEGVALDLKALLGFGEVKAGRVLSRVNEERLLGAVKSLVAVLKAAGLEIDDNVRRAEDKIDGEEDKPDSVLSQSDSTAPSTYGKSLAEPFGAEQSVLDPDLVARGLLLMSGVS